MPNPCRTRATYFTCGGRKWGIELESRRWDYAELRLTTPIRTRLLTWKANPQRNPND